MAHTLTHYKKNPDGTLRLIRTELVDDPPRTKLDFASLAYRDAYDIENASREAERFEALADAACASEG